MNSKDFNRIKAETAMPVYDEHTVSNGKSKEKTTSELREERKKLEEEKEKIWKKLHDIEDKCNALDKELANRYITELYG